MPSPSSRCRDNGRITERLPHGYREDRYRSVALQRVLRAPVEGTLSGVVRRLESWGETRARRTTRSDRPSARRPMTCWPNSTRSRHTRTPLPGRPVGSGRCRTPSCGRRWRPGRGSRRRWTAPGSGWSRPSTIVASPRRPALPHRCPALGSRPAAADLEAAHALARETGPLQSVSAALRHGEITRAHADAAVRVARDLPKRLATTIDPESGLTGMAAADAFLAEHARSQSPRTVAWLGEQLLSRLAPDRRDRLDPDAVLRRTASRALDPTRSRGGKASAALRAQMLPRSGILAGPAGPPKTGPWGGPATMKWASQSGRLCPSMLSFHAYACPGESGRPP